MANSNPNLEALVTKLLREEFARLVRFIAWRVNEFVAEDAVAFAFERMAFGDMQEGHSNPVGWLRLVAYREALSLTGVYRTHRGEAVEFVPLDALGDPAAASGDPLAIVLQGEVLGLLDKLTDNERDALELQAEGLSYDEMMERREWSRRQVGRYIYEGRQKLRKLLEEAEGGES